LINIEALSNMSEAKERLLRSNFGFIQLLTQCQQLLVLLDILGLENGNNPVENEVKVTSRSASLLEQTINLS
jgi:hypothetical protein